ncbi:LXG domain of WXG superfamily protein [Psychrobacillus sp. OK028]|uniref:ribonuclease YeeF family protein n=1 Tax=Psychrobacillus sp. OK028 TaxID=1884359 RepID=UPI0008805A9D|nr:LXG domain-containing protein [Psychrobacillus sp. OK028]SDM41555.1 LXG domain of WXG superfamily protein [Psychrobacillus sp. OK028]
MKILDVQPFQDGIQRNTNMLTRLEGEITAIQTAVQGLVAMEETLKGEGGNAIRSFYNDAHLPFLHFFLTFKATFNTTLTTMKSALDALEPNANGYIRQAYLEGEVEQGLTEISQVTTNLTDESNVIMDSVSDIVALPHLDDSGVQEGVTSARTSRDNTVTDLNEFDMTQTSALVLIEAAILNMEAWLTDIEYLMDEGLTDINFPADDWNYVQDATPIGQFYLQHQIDILAADPRIDQNDVEVSAPAYTEKNLWEGIMTTVGLDINDWQNKPINAAANFVGFAAAGNATYKDVRLASKGFGITRTTRTTHQNVTKTVLKITRPELLGVKKKTYSGADAERYEKIFKRVDPATNVKSTFRFSANKLGYIGVFATAGGDIIHGVQNNESASQIAGNVTGDVAIAGASMAASAWAGAQAGATVGAFGGPVGVVAGAAAGLIAGVVVTTLLSEVKIFDVNNDGQNDSIGDAIKIGTKGLIDSVSSWFK